MDSVDLADDAEILTMSLTIEGCTTESSIPLDIQIGLRALYK
jgi:hypothetical protein